MRSTSCATNHACLELIWALVAAGERTAALDMVERIPRDRWIVYWSRRAEFDPIRNEPRFQTVVREAHRF